MIRSSLVCLTATLTATLLLAACGKQAPETPGVPDKAPVVAEKSASAVTPPSEILKEPQGLPGQGMAPPSKFERAWEGPAAAASPGFKGPPPEPVALKQQHEDALGAVLAAPADLSAAKRSELLARMYKAAMSYDQALAAQGKQPAAAAHMQELLKDPQRKAAFDKFMAAGYVPATKTPAVKEQVAPASQPR